MWRAAERLGIPVQAATSATEAGLAEFSSRVRFRHPLARSVAYRSASLSERQELHAALAKATDPQTDLDRGAWHQAQAAAGPDEEVAVELERSAGRAQARGGLAATAAFLRRSVALTADLVALGIEARCRALLSDGTAADDLYREAIDRLSRISFHR